jgi:1-acyl-sn-glycerol-3-phosphate acyltransferase
MPNDLNQLWIEKAALAVSGLRAFHRHRVVGIENIPKSGPALLAVNHSLASYDIMLLLGAIYEKSGRITRPLVDRLFFKIPYLGDVVTQLGCTEGNPKGAGSLLQDGEIVAVAPGGMEEALRPSNQKYQIKWSRRKGFARLAIENQVPVILAACPKADDLYDLWPNPITDLFYQKFRVPFPIARGLGPTVIPKPIRLTHFVGTPIAPPKRHKSEEKSARSLEDFHQLLIFEMEKLMTQALHE